jgi:hypothetical protein
MDRFATEIAVVDVILIHHVADQGAEWKLSLEFFGV